jgi:hypothetical protein
VFGSRRRAYVIINGGVQCVVLLSLVGNVVQNPMFITSMLFISQINSAFLDVVVDAMMV